MLGNIFSSEASKARKRKFREMKSKLKTAISLQQDADTASENAAAAVAKEQAATEKASQAAKELLNTSPKGGRKRKSRKVKKSRKHRGGKKTKKRPVLVDAYCRRSRKKTRGRK
jgi:hypothetical protein